MLIKATTHTNYSNLVIILVFSVHSRVSLFYTLITRRGDITTPSTRHTLCSTHSAV